MRASRTDRGFWRIEFEDANGEGCSLQESSVATGTLMWLGRDETRMHLTRADVAALLPALQRFASKGEIVACFGCGGSGTARHPDGNWHHLISCPSCDGTGRAEATKEQP